jgi:hypothetical protein
MILPILRLKRVKVCAIERNGWSIGKLAPVAETGFMAKNWHKTPDFFSPTRFLASPSRMLQDFGSIALSSVFLLNQVAV